MKINKLIVSIKNRKDGFTLAELLAVLTIFVIITGVVTSIIYSTLRGATKTKVTTNVAQNGAYAVSVLTQMIADSRNVVAVNGSSISDCISAPGNSSDTAPIPTPPGVDTKPSITLRRMDGGFTTITCRNVGSTYTIASNTAALTYTSLVNNSLVRVQNGSCKFSCSQLVADPYSVPIVKVSFSLLQKDAAALFEGQSSANFSTSTSLRVYSP